MLLLFIYSIIFFLATAASVVLLAERGLLSLNLLSFDGMFALLMSWRFYAAIITAFISRITFMLMNNVLQSMPKYAGNSTNITTLISLFASVFILLANYIFLGEAMNIKQFSGAFLVLAGMWVLLS